MPLTKEIKNNIEKCLVGESTTQEECQKVIGRINMKNTMPKWNELFKESLLFYSDQKPHINREAKVAIADSLNLISEIRREITEKYKGNKIEGRVGWALSALKISGLLRQYERGSFIITDLGLSLIKNLPEELDENYLINNYESYRKNKERNLSRNKERKISLSNTINDYTPEEVITLSIETLNDNLSNLLLERLYEIDPYKLEHVVSELLEKMGYGELEVTKKSNDGGIDAIVNEDKLGLDKILVQTKRYKDTNIIRPPLIRDFLGALASKKIQKGIFVTTSSFDLKAVELAKNSDKKLILIDGERLTKLMIDYNIGVSSSATYTIKNLDTDYFDE